MRHFAVEIMLVATVGLVAVLSNRITERLRVPVPVIVLVLAAVAVEIVPALHAPPDQIIEPILTGALILILFDGGMHIGVARLRSSIAPVALMGVLGTFLTAFGGAVLLHFAFGLSWYVSLLVATAIAPTDPAVVFSVLGKREIKGRSGTVLEGESGANDPVGIALMSSLITAGQLSGGAVGQVALQFVEQMAIGLAIGVVSGYALLWFMRRVPLPGEGLYPLRTLAVAALVYAVTTLAFGSGFLAVFTAGIVIGDERAPFKREVERFHDALASLAEIVAFVVLGLTIDLAVVFRHDVLVPGLVLAVVVAFVVRPVLVGACLLPAKLSRNEMTFILFAGLKGAVPLLLGELLVAADVPDSERLYGIVAVVVVFSVLVQGTATPAVAGRLKIPMREIEPMPWVFGVRLREEPGGARHVVVGEGSPADGRAIEDLEDLSESAWISMVVRSGQLIRPHGDTVLSAGDEVILVSDNPGLDHLFGVG